MPPTSMPPTFHKQLTERPSLAGLRLHREIGRSPEAWADWLRILTIAKTAARDTSRR